MQRVNGRYQRKEERVRGKRLTRITLPYFPEAYFGADVFVLFYFLINYHTGDELFRLPARGWLQQVVSGPMMFFENPYSLRSRG